MLENPHAGDDLGSGGGRPALQALLHRLHERGNAARAHVLQAARAQRPGPGGQLAQLAVLVVASDRLDLRGIPVQTEDKVSPGVVYQYRTVPTYTVYGTISNGTVPTQYRIWLRGSYRIWRILTRCVGKA